jgi:hypothetical protein
LRSKPCCRPQCRPRLWSVRLTGPKNGCAVGAPGEIRTPDPQIRSLGPDIDFIQLLCKPDAERPLVHQGVTSGDANQKSSDPPWELNAIDGGRERSDPLPLHLQHDGPFKRPARPSNPLLVQLNEKWRVVVDPLQWILQRKDGGPRSKNSGWQSRSFCTTRDGLLRCVRESCGDVEEFALAALHALPQYCPSDPKNRSAFPC